MRRLLFVLFALLISTSAFSQGLSYGTQSVAGSAPTKSATEINTSDLTTFTLYTQDRWGTTNAVSTYNPVEIYETSTQKMVRYVVPNGAAVKGLTPQSFAGYETVNFTVTEWTNGIADTVGASSHTIRINGGLYPAITKPIQITPVPAKHYAIGQTDISGATQDVQMLGLYEVPNASNYSFLYLTATPGVAGATEEIILRATRNKVD